MGKCVEQEHEGAADKKFHNNGSYSYMYSVLARKGLVYGIFRIGYDINYKNTCPERANLKSWHKKHVWETITKSLEKT